jgi:hypothetical protein
MDEPKPEIKRHFTQADYEAGLCDKNGLALPGGPDQPPKKPIKDSVPTKAQEALAPEPPPNVPADPNDPANQRDESAPLGADPNFDPLKVDAKPAEEGFAKE